MQKPVENPALVLREALLALQPFGMLRWDHSGRALLVSDALRHTQGAGFLETLYAMNLRFSTENGLVWIDLPPEAYQALLAQRFFSSGPWTEDWFAEQALLATILQRSPIPLQEAAAPPDELLLRRAMLACAQGTPFVRQLMPLLRAEDATQLRAGNAGSCRASAVLCAHWLCCQHGVGLPPIVFTSNQNHN